MVTKQVEMKVWSKNSVLVWANTGESGSRFVEVSFTDNESPFDLTDRSVILYAEKPDKMVIFNDCQIVGDPQEGKILLEITEQMIAVQGIVNCEFHVIENNSIILKVVGMKIIVSECVFNELEIQSSSEYSTLLSAIQNANSALQTAQDLVDTIEAGDFGSIDTENGTWTPEFIAGGSSGTMPTYSITTRKAQYCRIGKICYVTFWMRASITAAGTRELYIGGFPYQALAESGSIGQSIPLGNSYDTSSSPGGAFWLYENLNYGAVRIPNSLMLLEKFKVTNQLDLHYSGCYIINSIYY